jgi:hypothetical protein
MQREATELEYLQYFYRTCDFGPADGDVRWGIRQMFVSDTGMRVPEAYREEAEE